MEVDQYFSSSKTSEELWERLHKALLPFGVTYIYYGVGYIPDFLGTDHLFEIMQKDTGLHTIHSKTSYPLELKVSNERKYCLEKDTSALHCLFSEDPFLWDCKSKWVNSKERQFEESKVIYWYDLKKVGVTIPLRFGDLGKGGVGLSISKLSSEEFDDVWLMHKEEIIRIVTAFDRITRTCYLDLIGIKITKRDKDILAWLAEGHSAKVIADQLGTKQNTVQNQVINLRKKLTARNNVQLIAKALTFQLI